MYAAAQFVGPNAAPLTVEAQNALELAVSKAPGWIYGRLTQVGWALLQKVLLLLQTLPCQHSGNSSTTAEWLPAAAQGVSAGSFAANTILSAPPLSSQLSVCRFNEPQTIPWPLPSYRPQLRLQLAQCRLRCRRCTLGMHSRTSYQGQPDHDMPCISEVSRCVS